MIDKLRSLDSVVIVFFALFGGAARFVLKPPRERSLISVVSSLVVAGFSGVLVWAVMDARGFSTMSIAVGTGIGGLLGDDILQAILGLGDRLRENPKEFIDWWRKGGDKK